ncbi:hypothetical protein [Geopsychrobacter electrodiphilus]|uniref:hypothetical protein n=1 Tax=Geopsychrobacter electrodiphilus TaxID=225196 RepID=UPI00037DD355|nr:hypothetical protein [Geopsychrobacter electrodiphilus]
MCNIIKILVISPLMLLMLLIGSASAAESPVYYSDYFSFIGQDETGYLLFALDNNRGVDKGKFQAAHFGVLYDEHQGWIDLVGTGAYPNPTEMLTKIPYSTTFQIYGHSNSGIRIQSRINDLRLEINPLQVKLIGPDPERHQRWGNAAAVLYWQGRTIPGRVIHEELDLDNRNRLTHRYSSDWDNFQGFYLALLNGPPASWGDIYLQAEGKKNLKTFGFFDSGHEQAKISAPDLEVNKKGWALGFYRWDKGWQMHLNPVPSAELPDPLTPLLTLKQVSRQTISNWGIGGFAISVVEGKIETDGRSNRVLGFAELIK